jgi:hypothetical protein
MNMNVDKPPSRTLVAGLLVAGLVLMLAFAISYIGAFHRPTPHRVPLALIDPAPTAKRQAAELNALPGRPLQVRLVGTVGAARRQIDQRSVYGAFDARHDRLYVAAAANPATASALTLTVDRVLAAQHQPAAQVTDLKPLPASDPNGTVPFYAVIAWVFGGYLGAVLVGLLAGSRSRSRRLALVRIGALAAFAVIGGLLQMLILRGAFGVLEGHTLTLWGTGALIVLASGAATAGLQAIAGIGGTGLVILFFVIIGNAASGGPFARPLLPGFWRVIGTVLPPGAGVDAIRGTLYFGNAGTTRPLLILLGWLLAGGGVAVLRGGRRTSASEAEVGMAAAAAL